MPRVVGVMKAETAAGLALTGIDVMPVESVSDLKRTLLSVVDSREYSLVIVDEDLFADLDDRTREAVVARNLPLVIPIPARLRWMDVEALPPDDYVAMLIRRAVGYQLNIHL